jgi:hypothetical protein
MKALLFYADFEDFGRGAIQWGYLYRAGKGRGMMMRVITIMSVNG